jgi:hypothetical protein
VSVFVVLEARHGSRVFFLPKEHSWPGFVVLKRARAFNQPPPPSKLWRAFIALLKPGVSSRPGFLFFVPRCGCPARHGLTSRKGFLRNAQGFATEGAAMRLVKEAVLILVIGLVGTSVAYVATCWPFTDLDQGELRCEEGGAVVIRIAGKDYAVNGAASWRYPPVQQIWNKATYPNADIDRLTVKGLTLCDWGAPPPKHHYLSR